jgi:hypothetical protein
VRIAHKSRKKEFTLFCLDLIKSHYLASRFLSGSRAWKFLECFGSRNLPAHAIRRRGLGKGIKSDGKHDDDADDDLLDVRGDVHQHQAEMGTLLFFISLIPKTILAVL